MTIPLWVFLGFAAWTILLLVSSIGVYRWSRILTGRSELKAFRADQVEGPGFYHRAMRAHANCVENLPVYGAIAVALLATGLDTPTLDVLAIVLLASRVLQSTVHVAFEQGNLIAALRFVFFFAQLICMVWMGAVVVASAVWASS